MQDVSDKQIPRPTKMARTRHQKEKNAEKPHPRVTLIVNKSKGTQRNTGKQNKGSKPSTAIKTPATNPPSTPESPATIEEEPSTRESVAEDCVRPPSPTVEEILDEIEDTLRETAESDKRIRRQLGRRERKGEAAVEKKEERRLKYVLTCHVVLGAKHILPEESSVEIANYRSFNYEEFVSHYSKEVCSRSVRKAQDLQHLQTRATVFWGNEAKPSGGGMMARTVKGTKDWRRVEDMAGEWVGSGKKDVRVELKVEYREILEGDEDWVEDSEEEEDPKCIEEVEAIPASGKTSLGKKRAIGVTKSQKLDEKTRASGGKRRRTATMILEDEMNQEKSMEISWIPELMERWRCKNENCKQYRDGSCLVLQDGLGCRPLNAYILGLWDTAIKKGEAVVCAFPSSVKPPPSTNEKGSGSSQTKGRTSCSAESTTTSPVPMQISVSTPAPQIPWWLGSTPPASFTSSAFPIPSSSSSLLYPNTSSYSASSPAFTSACQPTPVIPQISPGPPPSFQTIDTQHPPSSPVHSNGLSASEHLVAFFSWFKKAYAGAGTLEGTELEDYEEFIGQVTHAHTALKKELYDLEGVRKMDREGWKELGVPVGLGKRISRAVREFEKVRS